MKRYKLQKLQARYAFIEGRLLVGIDPAKARHQAQILDPARRILLLLRARLHRLPAPALGASRRPAAAPGSPAPARLRRASRLRRRGQLQPPRFLRPCTKARWAANSKSNRPTCQMYTCRRPHHTEGSPADADALGPTLDTGRQGSRSIDEPRSCGIAVPVHRPDAAVEGPYHAAAARR